MMEKICQIGSKNAGEYDSPAVLSISIDACNVLCSSTNAGTETFTNAENDYLLF